MKALRLATLDLQLVTEKEMAPPAHSPRMIAATAMPNAADPFPILRSVVDLPEVDFNTGGSGDGEELTGKAAVMQYSNVFETVAYIAFGSAVVMILLTPLVKKLMQGVK